SALYFFLGRRPFASTLRARFTAALALVLLLGAGLALLVLARQSALGHLAAQETIGRSLIGALALGVQAAERADAAIGLDGFVSRLAADPAVAAVRLEDARGFRLYEYAHADENPSWRTALLAPETRLPRELSATL